MKFAAVVLAVVLQSSFAHAQCNGSFTATGSTAGWSAQWTVRGDMIDFVVSATTEGWVGIGFSLDTNMALSDFVIGAADTSSAQFFINDRYAQTAGTPVVDDIQNLNVAMVEHVGGQTTMSFTRARDTGDSAQDVNLDMVTYLLWATGPANINTEVISYHGSGSANRGPSDQVMFPSAADCPAIVTTTVPVPETTSIASSPVLEATSIVSSPVVEVTSIASSPVVEATSIASSPVVEATSIVPSSMLGLPSSVASSPLAAATSAALPPVVSETASLVPSPSPSPSPTPECTGSFTATGSTAGWSAQWTVRGDMIDFVVSATTSGWVGIGFSRDTSMANSDIIVGAADSDPALSFVSDRYATGRSNPNVDDSQDLIMPMVEEVGGRTTMYFTRIRVTGDSENDLELDVPTRLLWATGSVPDINLQTISYHGGGSTNRGVSNEITFPSPGECPATEEPLPNNVVCENSFSPSSSTWRASWTVYDNNVVGFTVSAETNNWIAIGFSLDNIMPNTDIVVGAIDPDNPSAYFVSDRFTSSRDPPAVDSSQDISRLMVTLEDGVTTISFVRPLNTSDRTGDIDLDRQFYMLWAIGGNVNNYRADDPNSIARHADRSASRLMTLCGGELDSSDSGIVSVAGTFFILTASVTSLLVPMLHL